MKKKQNLGISTLEIMIALFLLVSVATVAVVFVFQNQSMFISTETSQEAWSKALQTLEEGRAAAGQDFVNLVTTPSIADTIYTKQSVISFITPCENQLSGRVDWQQAPVLYNRSTELATLVSSPVEAQALGLDCLGRHPQSVWSSLHLISSLNLGSGLKVTSVDMLGQLVFVTAQSASVGDADFFVVNIQDPTNPQLLFSLDVSPGLNAVDAIKAPSGDYYAFVASHNSSFQFLVIKLPASLTQAPYMVAARNLPSVLTTGSFPQGRSVYYYDNKVYAGTKRTAGREFHIFDVSNPENPVWLSNKELNHNINGIVARKNAVFLATSGNSSDAMVLDANDVNNIVRYDINLPGNEDARSLFLLGSNLYLGRFVSNNVVEPDFYILDVTHPFGTLPVVGSLYVHAEVGSVRAVGDRVFLATAALAKASRLISTTNPSLPTEVSTMALPTPASALDYQDELLVAGSATDGNIFILGP